MASPSKLPPRRALGNGLGSRSRPMSMYDMPTDQLKRFQQADGNGMPDDSADNSATSKQAKRRSLLPTFSRKTSNDTSKAGAEVKESIGVIREDTSDSEVSSRPGTQNGSRPSTESTSSRAMMPPPKPAARTSSLRPPASATSAKATAHARTTSKPINGVPKRSTPPSSPQKAAESGHKRTDSARLPQSRMVAPSAQQAVPTRGSSVRASTSTMAQKRSSVSVLKPPVIDTSIAVQNITQASPTSPTRPASRPTSRQTSRTQMPPPSRATFSTYQQHYSPAKSALPKPPVPASKPAKPAAPVEVEIVMTLENVLEQIDLLQLSLMHQGSAQVMREYETHARHKLSRRHAKLRKDYESIRDRERDHRRAANLEALDMWCPDQALLTEHLHTLSRVAADLSANTEPGSRFSELTETFDKWATKARSILLDNQPATFIEALPETWRSAHTSLALKLRSIQRSISTLPPAPPTSDFDMATSLEMILENSSALVDGMLKELDVMTKLQKEVLQRGKERIDEQINALVNPDASRSIDKKNWRPAWQVVT